MSSLFITHDLTLVKAISDKSVIILEGRILDQGENKQVLSPPHHEYTVTLLASIPEMDPDWLGTLLENRAATFI